MNNKGQTCLQHCNEIYQPTEVQYFSKGNINVQSIDCGYAFSIFVTNKGPISVGPIYRGCGDCVSLFVKPVKMIIPKNVEIVNAFAGQDSNILISKKGVCYSSGTNGDGQLGIGTNEIAKVPTKVKISEKIESVAFTVYTAMFLTVNQNVYVSGDGTTVPKKLKSPVGPDKIIKIYPSQHYTFCLTETNKLYIYDHSMENELNEIRKVNIIKEDKFSIKDITCECSRFHILTMKNEALELYDYNDDGFGNFKRYPSKLLKKDVLQIECMAFSTFLFTRNGVYPNGQDNSNELGLGMENINRNGT